jgi:hypothetical protein
MLNFKYFLGDALLETMPFLRIAAEIEGDRAKHK